MGKSKKKGKGGKKGKGSKKKGKKVVEEEEPGPPPEQDTFVYIRRKNLTLCLETFEEQLIKELKIQVATILRQFPEDIALYSMLGKRGEEEMLEKEKPKKEPTEKKKELDNKSKRRSSAGSSRSARKSKDKGEKKDTNKEQEKKPPKDFTLGTYGYSAKTASIFNPAVIGLAYRGDDGEFEKLDFTPYTEFPVIPEEIKMHLRNYVPPPPPPPKKKGVKIAS